MPGRNGVRLADCSRIGCPGISNSINSINMSGHIILFHSDMTMRIQNNCNIIICCIVNEFMMLEKYTQKGLVGDATDTKFMAIVTDYCARPLHHQAPL